MEKEKKVSTWLIVFSLILVVVPLGFTALWSGFSYFFPALIGDIVRLFCAFKCSKWAKEIDKSMNWAFVIGFMFSLLGLLGYFIYYKSKEGEEEEKEVIKLKNYIIGLQKKGLTQKSIISKLKNKGASEELISNLFSDK
jgi:hypothetical protein